VGIISRQPVEFGAEPGTETRSGVSSNSHTERLSRGSLIAPVAIEDSMTVDDRSRSRARQLALFPHPVFERRPGQPPNRGIAGRSVISPAAPCLNCRRSEARYGFRDEDEADASRSFCFDCFMLELQQRRHRAQIAARHALEL
jgi:hypothetical protein